MSEQPVIWCVDSSDRFFLSEQASCQGVHLSPSYVKAMIGNQPENRGLYQANYRSLAQEATLERVRRAHYPAVVSRLGALFAYPDKEFAHSANEKHWQGERVLYQASVFSGSRCLLADSSWLACEPHLYEENAHRYFQGVISETPQLEMLVHGGIRCGKALELVDSETTQIDELLASVVQYDPRHIESQRLTLDLA